jgi:hypothetical protein
MEKTSPHNNNSTLKLMTTQDECVWNEWNVCTLKMSAIAHIWDSEKNRLEGLIMWVEWRENISWHESFFLL